MVLEKFSELYNVMMIVSSHTLWLTNQISLCTFCFDITSSLYALARLVANEQVYLSTLNCQKSVLAHEKFWYSHIST